MCDQHRVEEQVAEQENKVVEAAQEVTTESDVPTEGDAPTD